MTALWLGLLLAAPAPAPPPAARAEPAALQNPVEALRQAKNSFDYGSYEQAAKLAEQLVETHALERPQDEIEAFRLLGLARYFQHQAVPARDAFVNLLSLDPDYQLDPFYVPPQAIAFFESVRSDNQALLQPIRERRRAAQEALRLEEEARQKLLTQMKTPPEVPKIKLVNVRVERHSPAIALLPFGAGQFQNGNPKLAWALLIPEAVLAATSVLCYSWYLLHRLPDGNFDAQDYNAAIAVRAVQISAGGAFLGLWAFGAGEALYHFNSTVTVREEEAAPQTPPQQPAKPAPSGPAVKAAIGPIPGGAMGSLAVRF
ncbi:MAG: hypothetical protein ACYDCL_00270 [Myxococcales bacterium]